jgi:Resolvase, N terminal domain
MKQSRSQGRVMPKVRCAVYTRKSSEEGLDMEFNSLDAQREACEAYIASQKPEGWVLVHDHYDDGGVSGGTLERPALKRLLADIEFGKVDVVVVYKIDRLSRSLMDFAKLVEVFERRNVTFVSVTQSFNTTTSMGRLTLNVLLSFAQFVSASPPSTVSIKRPCAVVVSAHRSPRERNPAPAFAIVSSVYPDPQEGHRVNWESTRGYIRRVKNGDFSGITLATEAVGRAAESLVGFRRIMGEELHPRRAILKRQQLARAAAARDAAQAAGCEATIS